MPTIQNIHEKDLNWDHAQAYGKTSTLVKKNVRVSNGGEHIVTLNDSGAIEREGNTKPGDSVIRDSRGQEYIVTMEKFPALYEEDPANPESFRSKDHGIAMQVDEVLSITRNDGTTITTDADGWLFKSATSGMVNHIAANEFQRTYKPDPASAPTRLAADLPDDVAPRLKVPTRGPH